MVDVHAALRERKQTNGLLQAARTGDGAAYEQLVLRFEQPVFRLAYLIVRDPTAAAALATRGFVACSTGLERMEDPLAFLSALLGRVIDDAPLPQTPRRLGVSVAAPHSQQLPPEVAAVRGEQNRLILGGIGRLAADEQLLLYLRCFLGLDCNEAAGILGCSEGQARTRLKRALRRLSRLLGQGSRPARAASAIPALEAALQTAAAAFPYPPTAALAEEVRQRLALPQTLEHPVVRPTRGAARTPVARVKWAVLAGVAVAIVVVLLVVLLLMHR